jgi:hypothetical protein
MGLAAFGADDSLIVVGHLLQKSGKSCSAIPAENVHSFFRCAHGVSVYRHSGRPFPAAIFL